MCDYCKLKNNESLDEFNNLSIDRNSKLLKIEYHAYSTDSDWIENIPIKYCPICGEKL